MIKQVLIACALLAVTGCTGGQYADNVRPKAGASTDGESSGGRYGALMRVAKVTADSGNYPAAVSMYRQAHELNTGSQDPLLGLGSGLMRIGHYDDARETYRKAAEIQETPEALIGQANALIAMGQVELAMTHLERSMEIKQTWQGFNGCGIVHDLIGRHRIAQAYYRTGLEMNPQNMTIRNNLGLSLAVSGQYEKAIAVLRGAAGESGATPRTRLNLALVYGLAGDFDTAAEVARMDLDEAAVQQNLAFYATLRALKDSKQILRAIGGYASGNLSKQG